MPLLEIRDLHVRYGAIAAVSGINLAVESGQIVTLIGANGAGKTTILSAISGVCRPARGSIFFDHREITNTTPHQIVRLGIAQAPEGRGIFANMSVTENLDLGAYSRKDVHAVADDRERVLNLFPRLRERLKQNAGTLSGGEQQMLAIARSLLAKPRLLLLDEPSLGLAPQLVQTIFKIIQNINAQGTTILLVEQNAHMALNIAHYGYVLEVGKIVMKDTAQNLARSDEVRKAYLGVA